MLPTRGNVVRAAPTLPRARRTPELPTAPQHEPRGLYLHFYGVSAEDVAAILA
jgi:hypothetical protein